MWGPALIFPSLRTRARASPFPSDPLCPWGTLLWSLLPAEVGWIRPCITTQLA